MIRFHAGFDIGTDCVSAAVFKKDLKNGGLTVVFTPKPLFHFGNPVFVLRDLYEDILQRFGCDFPVASSFTGSGGRRFADCLSVPYHHDTIAIPAGAAHLDPGARYIFHMGARDAYFFEIEKIHTGQGHHTFVPDHGTGTKCGGGSGILVTKQCRRFFEHEFPMDLSGKTDRDIRQHLNERLCRIFQRGDEEIRKSDKHLDVGGRCGVVIQSDMIHMQNSGERIPNILAGMYSRIVRNYRSDVLGARHRVGDRVGVGHREDRREAAACCTGGARDDRLGRLEARLPQVGVRIDQAGQRHQAVRLHQLGARYRFAD